MLQRTHKTDHNTYVSNTKILVNSEILSLEQFVEGVRPKQNIALFPEDRVAKKSLTRAAAKKKFCTRMEIQMKKENKH